LAEKRRSKKTIWIAAGVGIAVAIAAGVAAFSATSFSRPSDVETTSMVNVYPPSSQPFGKTYEAWSIDWWKLIQTLPTSDNPVFDETGEKCHAGQDDPNMWFAMGTGGGKAERTCTIASSQAIFVPILGGECSDLEDRSLDTEQKRKDCAVAGAKRGIISLSVDGQRVPNLQSFWFEAPINDFELGPDNIWGVEPGIAQEYTAGYYVILEPLSVGEHEIHFSGVNTDIEGTQTFALEVIYDLTIVDEGTA
jgi:hypothetical protein